MPDILISKVGNGESVWVIGQSPRGDRFMRSYFEAVTQLIPFAEIDAVKSAAQHSDLEVEEML